MNASKKSHAGVIALIIATVIVVGIGAAFAYIYLGPKRKQGQSCNFARKCASGYKCLSGTCAITPGTLGGSCSTACETGLKCSHTGVCVPATGSDGDGLIGSSCTTSADCETSLSCRSGICTNGDQGTDCVHSTDCNTGLYCATTNLCTTVAGSSCSTAAPCPTGYTCTNGKCAANSGSSGNGSGSGTGVAGSGCATTADCSIGATCTSGVCVNTCTVNSDCPVAVQSCMGGTCVCYNYTGCPDNTDGCVAQGTCVTVSNICPLGTVDSSALTNTGTINKYIAGTSYQCNIQPAGDTQVAYGNYSNGVFTKAAVGATGNSVMVFSLSNEGTYPNCAPYPVATIPYGYGSATIHGCVIQGTNADPASIVFNSQSLPVAYKVPVY